MGFWKHQQEILRGGDPQACAGRAGCADCFEEGGLKDFVAANAHYQRRDICGASARSEIGADLFDVIEHMNECLDPYYSTAEEKLPYESAEGRRIRTPRESRASCDRHLSHRGSKMDAVRRRTRQLDLDLRSPLRWGGRRTGAGRKPGPRARDAHRKRPPLAARFPCHVTLKVRRDLPRSRAELAHSVRTRLLPGRPLFAAARSPAPDRGSNEPTRSRRWHEVRRSTPRESCEPGLPASRAGPPGSLPPARPPNSP